MGEEPRQSGPSRRSRSRLCAPTQVLPTTRGHQLPVPGSATSSQSVSAGSIRTPGAQPHPREPHSGADLLHPLSTQAGQALTQSLLRDRDRFVQIYCASTLHPVGDIQDHLRRHVSHRGGNWCHGYARKMADGAIASEYQNRSLLVRRRKLAKVNITAVQSSGQAAVSSQGRYSSLRWGWT